ncbi:MAG: heavy-metal-associated domain-containing protein [Bacilli bacterium]|nr:heavy-metal-associated domain-containing protein [Bacilli bacterium]
MNKYILGIDGMKCGMCELHVEDAIRKAVQVKRIKGSRVKKNVEVFTELNLSEDDFKCFLSSTGYRITSFERVSAIKKWYGWR